jgi:hypothetical protein
MHQKVYIYCMFIAKGNEDQTYYENLCKFSIELSNSVE